MSTAIRRRVPPVGVGLLGCGRIARMFHLPVLGRLRTGRLVAVADPDPAALAAARSAVPDAVGLPDLDALLESPTIEAVVICLPTHLHAAAATAVLAAGRHVYVEKPLAADLDGAAAVRAAWRRGDRTGTVGFNFRFHPLYRAARELLAAKALGEVVAVRTAFSSAPRELPAWKLDRATGGGALLDLASHHIDLVRHLLGAEVEVVTAAVRSHRTPEDTAVATLRLSTGLEAQLLATVSAAAGDRVEILGTEATAEIDRMGRRRITVIPAVGPGRGVPARLGAAGRVLRESGLTTLDRLRPPPEPSFAAALAAFVDDARADRGRAPSVAATIDDGYRGVAVVAAAERSARTGRAEPVSR